MPPFACAGAFFLQCAGVDASAGVVVKILEITVAGEVSANISASAVLIVWD